MSWISGASITHGFIPPELADWLTTPLAGQPIEPRCGASPSDRTATGAAAGQTPAPAAAPPTAGAEP